MIKINGTFCTESQANGHHLIYNTESFFAILGEWRMVEQSWNKRYNFLSLTIDPPFYDHNFFPSSFLDPKKWEDISQKQNVIELHPFNLIYLSKHYFAIKESPKATFCLKRDWQGVTRCQGKINFVFNCKSFPIFIFD